ncbi:MAG: insulinase family protein [Gammaproteobacteria bacterium]|nr:insulinase family protein [Gammaproteobacteria bacterium]
MRIYISLLVLVAFVLGAVLFVFNDASSPVKEGEVQAFELTNGMKLRVIENHRAPVVVSQIWYNVGSSFEHDGITGVSHVLEHMMFKGTPDYPAGKFSEIIAANGGKENAFTSKDYTAYFQRIASDKLEICLSMEADRMRNLILDEAEFLKEVEVVKEERRLRTDDKPTGLLYERFNAMAYTNSPYRQPIIGWMEDLDSMTIDDLRRWYKRWYAPNNATLVVVGDVDADEVFKLAREYFSSLPIVDLPEIKPRREAEQYGVQRMTMQLPAEVPTLLMGYKVPVLISADDTEEAYALEVLAGLLDGGDSARLTKNLIRGEQLATSAGAGYSLYSRHEDLFTFSVIPSDGVSMEQIEAAIKNEIELIKNTPPEQKELDRVIAQVLASSVYEQDSSFYRAMQIGILETLGLGWQVKDEYIAKIKAVTAEQVQQVAKKYLVDKHLSVAILDPLPIENKAASASSASAAGAHHVN